MKQAFKDRASSLSYVSKSAGLVNRRCKEGQERKKKPQKLMCPWRDPSAGPAPLMIKSATRCWSESEEMILGRLLTRPDKRLRSAHHCDMIICTHAHASRHTCVQTNKLVNFRCSCVFALPLHPSRKSIMKNRESFSTLLLHTTSPKKKKRRKLVDAE